MILFNFCRFFMRFWGIFHKNNFASLLSVIIFKKSTQGCIFCSKFIFFPRRQIFLFFVPPLVFSHQVGGKMEKYLKNYILLILSLLPHIFLVFSPRRGVKGGNGKMFSVFLIFTFFSPPTTYFLFFLPPSIPEPGQF